ncbi:DUF4275 family protein, partial [Bacillus sp. MHSD17]|nr:DUF4275 family protein [Bacillus sp. MHSD17]
EDKCTQQLLGSQNDMATIRLAENAFHNEVKKDCYIFYQHCDDVLLIKDASLLHLNDILCETDDMYKGDIYIVGKEFTWTFVKTHEHRWCGPYFTKRCW